MIVPFDFIIRGIIYVEESSCCNLLGGNIVRVVGILDNSGGNAIKNFLMRLMLFLVGFLSGFILVIFLLIR